MPRSSNETRIIIYDSDPNRIQIVIDLLRNQYPRGFSNSPVTPASQGDLHAICSLYLKESPSLADFMPRSRGK